MRSIAFAAVVVSVIGCSKSETPADSAAAAATPVATAPAPISLADVAGTWNVKAMNERGDSTLVTYTLKATADTGGWTMTLADRPPQVVHVLAVAGDSIVTHVPPYESVLRKGVKVETNGVFRLQGGKLVGRTVAHYSVKTADSVRVLVSEGTRAP
jgi:hypothetical protein